MLIYSFKEYWNLLKTVVMPKPEVKSVFWFLSCGTVHRERHRPGATAASLQVIPSMAPCTLDLRRYTWRETGVAGR